MKFLDQLSLCANGKLFPFTIKLRDPLGNSFISAPLGSFLPPEQDQNLVIKTFIRTFEEVREIVALRHFSSKELRSDVRVCMCICVFVLLIE